MFITLIILYAWSFWGTASRTNPGSQSEYWPFTMLLSKFWLQDIMYWAWEMYALILKHQNTAPLHKNIKTPWYHTYLHIPCLKMSVLYILVHTSTYQDIKWCTCSYSYIPVHTSIYLYVPNGLFSSRCTGWFQMISKLHHH